MNGGTSIKTYNKLTGKASFNAILSAAVLRV